MSKFASLCLLSYKRPESLASCLNTIKKTADFPHEIIINSDGNDIENQQFIYDSMYVGRTSKIVLNGGLNRGVGHSFKACVALSEGDYIFKIDTDLTFSHKWLSSAIKALEAHSDVGAISLFNYRNYDPSDTRFEILEQRDNCNIVNDFVSSIYGFRRSDLAQCSGYDQDDGFHQELRSLRGKLAITKQDFVHNSGFGIGKSVYVTGTAENPRKTETHNLPLIFPGR